MEQLLLGRPEELVLDVAGKYEPVISETWLDAGLNGFIFVGQDKVDKLIAINDTLKGGVTMKKPDFNQVDLQQIAGNTTETASQSGNLFQNK